MSNALLVVNTNNQLTENSRQSFKDACRRWNCDFIEYTDGTGIEYHGSVLKLKAFELCNHDRILVIDSDTIIRSDTPNIFNLTVPEKFYAVKNQQSHYPASYLIDNIYIAEDGIKKILSQKDVKGSINIEDISANFFNSGVFLVSREHHQKVLERAFHFFMGIEMLQWWDQMALNVAVYSLLGGYTDIGSMWNYQFPSNMSVMSAYIYHFAGNPHRYNILNSVNWFNVYNKIPTRNYLHNLINILDLKSGVEVGVQKGEYSEYLLKNTYINLYLIDVWKHLEGYKDIANVSDYEHELNLVETRSRVQKYSNRYHIIQNFSINAASSFKDSSLDFIYLDADHSYKGIMNDLIAWFPKIRDGGVLSGHDFLDGENICGSEFGVRSALLDFIEDKPYKIHITNEQWPTWYFIKER